MRRSVAILAVRDVTMAGMADAAIDRAMFARRGRPFAVYGIMTGRAGRYIGVFLQRDLQGLVDVLMAGGAGIERLGRLMALMAFEAVRDIAVTVVVTAITTLLRMSAGKSRQRLSRCGMAVGTDQSELLKSRCALRCMRVLVTIGAGDLFRPMRLSMTACAARHQFRIIILERIIHVKKLVALLAGKTMQATGIFQVGILVDMTLTAINRGKRFRIVGIEFYGDLGKLAYSIGCPCRPGKNPGQQKHRQCTQQDADSR